MIMSQKWGFFRSFCSSYSKKVDNIVENVSSANKDRQDLQDPQKPIVRCPLSKCRL